MIINTSDSLNGCGSYLFQANNLYDPNYTGTGHQPSTMINSRNLQSLDSDLFQDDHRGATCLKPFQVQCVLLLDDDASRYVQQHQPLTERAVQSLGLLIQATVFLTLSKTWSAPQVVWCQSFDNDNLQGTVSAGPSEGVLRLHGARPYRNIAISSLPCKLHGV